MKRSPVMIPLFVLLSACAGVTVPPPTPTAPPPTPPVAPPPALECGTQFPRGRAVSSSATAFLCRAGYAVLHSPTRNTPLVVAERLEPAAFDNTAPRTNDFRPDLELPSTERSELTDYRLSG